MKAYTLKFSLLFFLLLASLSVHAQRRGGMISGRIISTEKETVDFATVYLKGTSYGGTTNQEGLYHIKAPAGDYTLVVSAVGYTKVEKKVKLVNDERMKLNITIAPETQQLDEVTIVSTGVSRVKRSAFNAVAVDTKELQNTTKNLSDALTKAPGMKLRESGGVGSDMQLMLDGFSGKHVKVFIDGVPQEGVGSSFSLNNIPVSFADRIEVYKGVVPVGFGTDAIGGVINIVTNKKRRNWFLDASYSYGSFNTHRSYVNFGQTFKNGFSYEINALYLTKTFKKVDIEHCMERIFEITSNANFKLRFEDTTFCIPYDNILYIQGIGEESLIVMKEGSYKLCLHLEELDYALPGQFIWCAAHTLVNIKYVRQIEKKGLLLWNDEQLEINPDYRQAVVFAYINKAS